MATSPDRLGGNDMPPGMSDEFHFGFKVNTFHTNIRVVTNRNNFFCTYTTNFICFILLPVAPLVSGCRVGRCWGW